MQNKNSKYYFDNHKEAKEFWWTSDGRHFFSEAGATAHAANLKKKGKGDAVEHVTREDVEEKADETPEHLVINDTDSDELKAAKKGVTDALAAKAALAKDASVKAKGDATKALNAAQKVLDAFYAVE